LRGYVTETVTQLLSAVGYVCQISHAQYLDYF